MSNQNTVVRYTTIESIYGHDGILIEVATMVPILADFLAVIAPNQLSALSQAGQGGITLADTGILNRHAVKKFELTRLQTLRTNPIRLSLIGVVAAFMPIVILACLMLSNFLIVLYVTDPLVVRVPWYISSLLFALKFPWVLLISCSGVIFALTYQWSVRHDRWLVILYPKGFFRCKPIEIGLDSIIAMVVSIVLCGALLLSRKVNLAILLWGANGFMSLVGGLFFSAIWHAFFDPLIRKMGCITADDLREIEKHSAPYPN